MTIVYLIPKLQFYFIHEMSINNTHQVRNDDNFLNYYLELLFVFWNLKPCKTNYFLSSSQ